MLLERLVSFLVLGFFVFRPRMSDWWQFEGTWYAIYVPWLLLTFLCLLLHFGQSRQARQVRAQPVSGDQTIDR